MDLGGYDRRNGGITEERGDVMSGEFRTFERRSRKPLKKGERIVTVPSVKTLIQKGQCFIEGNVSVETFGDGEASTVIEGAFRSVKQGCIESDVVLKEEEKPKFLKALNDGLSHVLLLRGVKEVPEEFKLKKVIP